MWKFILFPKSEKKDDVSSPVYSFIKNRPYFKTIHSDDTIYKKSNVECVSICDNLKYDVKDDLKTGETKAMRSTMGKCVSGSLKY